MGHIPKGSNTIPIKITGENQTINFYLKVIQRSCSCYSLRFCKYSEKAIYFPELTLFALFPGVVRTMGMGTLVAVVPSGNNLQDSSKCV